MADSTTTERDMDDSVSEISDVDPRHPMGYVPWSSDTTLASGGALTEMSKYEEDNEEFFQLVKIRHYDAFTLRPVIITTGALKGQRALVIGPVSSFRFLDLPPELRCMVYELLLDEPNTIEIQSFKLPHLERRPVREGFRNPQRHECLIWDKLSGKWTDQAPSNFALLRVCKQIFKETAPIAYGNNCFDLQSISEMAIFLRALGSLRQYVQSIGIPKRYRYGWPQGGVGRSAFAPLKDALSLQTLSIHHTALCNDGTRVGTALDCFLNDIGPLMKKLYKARKASNTSASVLDIVTVM